MLRELGKPVDGSDGDSGRQSGHVGGSGLSGANDPPVICHHGRTQGHQLEAPYLLWQVRSQELDSALRPCECGVRSELGVKTVWHDAQRPSVRVVLGEYGAPPGPNIEEGCGGAYCVQPGTVHRAHRTRVGHPVA